MGKNLGEHLPYLPGPVAPSWSDTFRPAWIGYGNSKAIRANIQFLESDRDLLLSCSGLGGLLIKSFDDQHQIGSVQWIRIDENETGPQYMQRARRQAENDTPKAGLVFASSGSLGLRQSASAVPSLWRLQGLQKFDDKSDVIALLSANFWLTSRHSPSEFDVSVPAGSRVSAEQELSCLVTDMRYLLRTPLSHALRKLPRSNRCPSRSRSSAPKRKSTPSKQRPKCTQ